MPSLCAPTTGRRAGALALTAVLSACSLHGLAFRKDDRLQIENLPDRSSVEVPFDLEWSFDGELKDGESFAVLVDWTPPPPGKSLESLLKSDPACQGPTGCPDGYLERNRIHTTTDTSMVIDNVPLSTSNDRRGYHEVTIILVDEEGRRIGETSAWSRFKTPGLDR